jgi:hypothetical protein
MGFMHVVLEMGEGDATVHTPCTSHAPALLKTWVRMPTDLAPSRARAPFLLGPTQLLRARRYNGARPHVDLVPYGQRINQQLMSWSAHAFKDYLKLSPTNRIPLTSIVSES